MHANEAEQRLVGSLMTS